MTSMLPIIQERRTKTSIFVVLKVTQACNMGCRYCSAEKDVAKVPLLTGAMGKAVIDALIDLGLPSYSVCFHGGEPLLGFKAIRETVEYAQGLPAPVDFRFSIQSNLSLMTDAIAAWCHDRHVSVGFSLDGEPTTNEVFRVFHDGRGTTHATLNGLATLQRYQRRVGCVAVIGGHNFDKTAGFFHFLLEHGVDRVSLNRMAPVGKGIDVCRHESITDEQYVTCLTDCYLMMVESKYRIQVKPITDWARKIIHPASQSHGCYECGAGWSHISVDPVGNVYACDRFTFDPHWISGNLRHAPLLEIFNESKMTSCRTRTERIPECTRCPVRYVCGGSCAVTSYYAKGTIDLPGHECGNMRQFIPWLDRRLAEHPIERLAMEAAILGADPQDVYPQLVEAVAAGALG